MSRTWIPVVVLLALVVGCGQAVSGGPVSTAEPNPGSWTRLPNSPLSPREQPAAAFLGGEVVFFGGYGGPPCPPTADCHFPEGAVRRDGGAFDMEAGTWRSIADAPRPVPPGAATAVIGERVYVQVDGALLVWHSVKDAWQQVSTPRPLKWSQLIADGTRLVVASGSDENGIVPDLALETVTGEWSTLPADPLKPSFDRTITATPEGLVLTAKAIEPGGGPADPGLVRAAVLPPGDDEWRKLPVSDQLAGWRWSWTGERLVEPTLGGSDGGQTNNYGRIIPYGGRLDPATGTWSRLPNAPLQGTGGWPVEAPGGRLVAAEGWVYDDGNGTWSRLPRPENAPESPGTAVWADGLLVVHGGTDWSAVDGPAETTAENVWSVAVWAYEPG